MVKSDSDIEKMDSSKKRGVLVTGASMGIGYAIARYLVERGDGDEFTVVGTTRNISKLPKGVVKDAPFRFVQMDVTEVGSVKRGVKDALDILGRIDVLVNNAGILIDRSFSKMAEGDWDKVLQVHLKGAFCVTRAAFPLMKENGFGRIVLTASAAGLFGNFGQANYAAAKSAMIGLMNVLKIEGSKYNVKINTIAPMAASRMTENLLPPEILEQIKPEFVSPIVAYLCSESCSETGGIYTAAGGHYGRVSIMEGKGFTFHRSVVTVDDIREKFALINQMDDATYQPSLLDHAGSLFDRIPKKEAQ